MSPPVVPFLPLLNKLLVILKCFFFFFFFFLIKNRYLKEIICKTFFFPLFFQRWFSVASVPARNRKKKYFGKIQVTSHQGRQMGISYLDRVCRQIQVLSIPTSESISSQFDTSRITPQICDKLGSLKSLHKSLCSSRVLRQLTEYHQVKATSPVSVVSGPGHVSYRLTRLQSSSHVLFQFNFKAPVV